MKRDTVLLIELKAEGFYSEEELKSFSSSIMNFICGPEGKGIPVGFKFSGEDKRFLIKSIEVKQPEQKIWESNVYRGYND